MHNQVKELKKEIAIWKSLINDTEYDGIWQEYFAEQHEKAVRQLQLKEPR